MVGCGPKKEPVHSGESAAGSDLSASLPWDAGVRKGVLDNGLTWYVERNETPEDRVVLRLVVDAGSVLEDQDQLGLAHFVEHMAFNGTEHFEGNEMIKYLESVGTKFGAHLNAHTSFDETVYKLMIPTDKTELVDQGFVVLRDWAGGILFDAEEIEKERGVVLEEWRSRLGPFQRSWELTIPLLYGHTAYPERLPIGTKESLENFEHDAVRRFYRDWYRPDLMAVVVVGDIDPDIAQAKIEELFSDLEMPESPRERTRVAIPSHDEVQAVVFTDPELTRASVVLGSKRDRVNGSDHQSYRDGVIEGLAFGILNERLADRAQEAAPPFLGAGAMIQQTTPTEGVDTMVAGIRAGGIRSGLEGLVLELERAKRHGFNGAELARAKTRRLEGLERSLVEDSKTSSTKKIGELVRNFTKNETVPGLAYEVEMHRLWLPGISVDEVSQFITTWLAEDSRLIIALEPAVEGLVPPTEQELIDLVAEVASRDIEPLQDEAVSGPLVEDLPAPGKIVSEEHLEDVDMTLWKLSNGATVYWKATNFKKDRLQVRATSPGGHSTAGEGDWVAARTASDIRRSSGLGGFDSSALSKRLAGTGATASTHSSTYFDRLSASTDAKSMTTMFELIWLHFTAPRFDEDAFSRVVQKRQAALENRLLNPRTVFADEFNKTYWEDHPRTAAWTVETLEQMDLAKSEAFHRGRFADASNFTFLLVGSSDPDSLKSHVLQYIATLPGAGTEETWVDRGARPLEGVHEDTVRVGSDPKAAFQLRFHGPMAYSFEERNLVRALTAILSVRLREELREDLGGVYGVGVKPSTRSIPYEYGAITIRFGCDPERLDELEERARAVVAEFLEGPVDASYVAQQQEKLRRQHEQDLTKNSAWLKWILMGIENGIDMAEGLEIPAWIDSLSPEVIHEAALRYLAPANELQFVMLPEQGTTE